jgi:hypothetical protein
MNRITLAFILLAIPWITSGQNGLSLTLGDCYAKAETASALAGEKDSYRSIWELKDKNIRGVGFRLSMHQAALSTIQR